jgi:hypothetical protein
MASEASLTMGRPSIGQQAGQLAADRPIGLTFFDILKQTAAELWPENTALELAVVTGYSAGNAQRVLVRKRRMSAEHALRLITSGADEGVLLERYIESLPAPDRGRAWAAVTAAVRRVELRESLARQRNELDRLESNLVKPRKSRR